MHSANELLDGCLWHVTLSVEGLRNHLCLPTPSTSVLFSLFHWQIKMENLHSLSQILLYLKKIFAFCSPRDFFSLPATSLSVSVKSNFSFKFKPELCPEISSSYSGVIFCISCYFAFRETESYLAEFYCSYQGHTAPIIKRAELLPCRTQIWLRKAMACPWLALGWC